MTEKQWYICISENVFGPVRSETIYLMLQQYRLQYLDFIWHSGLKEWKRISDLPEFANLGPPYPTVPPPSEATAPPVPAMPMPVRQSPVVAQAPKPAPAEKTTSPAPLNKIRGRDRIIVSGKVRVHGEADFDLINLSRSGIFVACMIPLKVGMETKFQLQISGLDKPLEMTGIVVRHGTWLGHTGFAFEFVRPNPAHLRILNEFIEMFDVGKTG